jgi:protein-tyrosine phosphatase
MVIPVRLARPGPHPDLTAIVPGLLVGSYPIPDDATWLRDTHRVTAIVNLQDHGDLASKDLRLGELERAYADATIAFHHLPVTDGDVDMLVERLPAIVDVVDRYVAASGCVYVHCNGGYNRAPTAAVAWLHERRGMSLDEALAFVKDRRSCLPYVRALERRYSGR